MGSQPIRLVQVAVVMIASLQLVSTLHCYTCSSELVPGCGEPFNHTKVPAQSCPIENQVCVKQFLPWAGTLRGCGVEGLCTLLKNSTADCETCSLELCNSGLIKSPSHGIMLFSIICLFFSMA
ncbi:hypothetical protein PPYR_12521 [Photinus pyralis]|uniref:Uncharacterized protein n=1 Tax=Photinus pyralis TaxID=7054 RepID=A0A5N4A6G2_PHOPY|nr:hypothetical protein PPYR_12521 [Photinus pyralis]